MDPFFGSQGLLQNAPETRIKHEAKEKVRE
jgi:hypothetical protein